MMFEWRKMGIIFDARGNHTLANTHTMVPCPMRMSDRIRLYYTSCCEKGVGRPFFVDLDITDLTKVIGCSDGPVMDIGNAGTFDENGVICCSLVRLNNKKILMYYAGFELGTKIRYRLLSGLAQSLDGGFSFSRVKDTPILERSDTELYFRGGPFALKTSKSFEMWYAAGSRWLSVAGRQMPQYDIRKISSKNGIDWPKMGKIQIPIVSKDDFAFGRPAVVEVRDNSYWMFFSVRKRSINEYRLGFAHSRDKINWERNDELLNLDVSSLDFETDAIMYATPLLLGEEFYLFYNGSKFGQHGIALAKLENFNEICQI